MPEIGKVIDDAMRAIEAKNSKLKNVLPKNYASPDLDKKVLGDVVDIFTNNIDMTDVQASEDLLGRTYEYCIAQFAEKEGVGGGEFYTPSSIVKTLVAILKPTENSRVYDPACGSGNFLTETFLSLRRLENKVIEQLQRGLMVLEFANPVKVSIGQFAGIEINDFAVTVARTALWIAESQMIKETEAIVNQTIEFFPLKTDAKIVEGNALRMDWNDVIPKTKMNYIMGNPPFSGARLMGSEQKEDLLSVFGKDWHNVGNLDYVTGWYKKAADFIYGTSITCAFVSTNSISQGEQVQPLWEPLFKNGLKINFAYRTFIWDSEANSKAHVHCVIIGFSFKENYNKKIFERNNCNSVQHINPYLIEAPDVFIKNRNKPVSNAPSSRSGNKPIDNGNYLFTKEEMEDFISKEPLAKKYFRPWYGSVEFIHRKPRYCLWLGEANPSDLIKMPECLKRIEAVKKYREDSKSEGTKKLAENPTRFHVETIPKSNYLIMPLTSSERRRYVPIGFMSADSMASNLVIVVPDATLYHFGILTSNVFMAWMRAICGRLKSDYRITKDNVYNNFPWPKPTDQQIQKIEQTAKKILDAREKYPGASFADMYSNLDLFTELKKAHLENDRAVMEAYGMWGKVNSESECVAWLFRMYEELTKQS